MGHNDNEFLEDIKMAQNTCSTRCLHPKNTKGKRKNRMLHFLRKKIWVFRTKRTGKKGTKRKKKTRIQRAAAQPFLLSFLENTKQQLSQIAGASRSSSSCMWDPPSEVPLFHPKNPVKLSNLLETRLAQPPAQKPGFIAGWFQGLI